MVGEGSMAEMAFDLGLDRGVDLRRSQVDKPEKNDLSPGIWLLGSNEKTTFSNTNDSY